MWRRICYISMERDAALEAYQALHSEKAKYHDGTFTSWSDERSRTHPYPAMAGVTIGAAWFDPAPHDDFTTNVNASPVPPSDGPRDAGA